MERTSISPQLARIDEAACIGCALCIGFCPVDAIVGAAKLMHTVLADRCTGCRLCLPPCPVDCIALAPRERAWAAGDAARAQANERARAMRLALRSEQRARPSSARPEEDALREQRRAAVAAALARARARREAGRRGSRA